MCVDVEYQLNVACGGSVLGSRFLGVMSGGGSSLDLIRKWPHFCYPCDITAGSILSVRADVKVLPTYSLL